jgi:dehydrogenase/reductase SDR family member 7B
MKVLVVAPGSVRTNVSKNALDATAQTRGVSDAAIDNGMDPAVAATRMLDALKAGERELILAEGMEAAIAKMRRTDPNALFDQMERMVAAGYAQRMGAEKK